MKMQTQNLGRSTNYVRGENREVPEETFVKPAVALPVKKPSLFAFMFAAKPKALGSAFTDWRDSIENTITGASDAAVAGALTPSGTPAVKPVAKTAIPGTIFGLPTTTVMIAGFGALLAWKFFGKK